MEKLPHWRITDKFPAVYDLESATAIEMTAKVYGAMNELIVETNQFKENTTKHISEHEKNVDDHLKEQDDDIENQKNNVIPIKIKDEVQRQIDDGTFDEQIDKYVGNLETRVNNILGSVTEGSITTMDAEVIDGRNGFDGRNYDNIGNALRGQVGEIHSFLNEMGVKQPYVEYIKDFYIDTSNSKQSINGFYMTKPFYVEAGTTICLMGKGYEQSVAMISKTNEEGSEFNRVVVSKDSTYREYTFNVVESGYYTCCSSYTNTTMVIYLKDLNYNYIKSQKQQKNALLKNDKLMGVDLIDVPFNDYFFITNYGSVETHRYYMYSKPFYVEAGKTIIVTGKGENNSISMISETNAEGTIFTPLILSSGSEIKDYTFTTKTGGYFCASGNREGIEIRIVNPQQNQVCEDVDYIQLFHKIGGIGDSLTYGVVDYMENGELKSIGASRYSWLSNIVKQYGHSWVNYSEGGMTAKAWVNREFVTQVQNETEKCSCYFIALGTNDAYRNEYEMGSYTDEVNENTFCGYIKKIIEIVTNANPHTKIFVMSLYGSSENAHSYSNQLSKICTLYDNCYYVDFIGISSLHTGDSNTELFKHNHFSALGYIHVANTVKKIVNDIVKNNMSDFIDIPINYRTL